MKKLCLLSAVLLSSIFVFAACGGGAGPTTTSTPSTTAVAQTTKVTTPTTTTTSRPATTSNPVTTSKTTAATTGGGVVDQSQELIDIALMKQNLDLSLLAGHFHEVGAEFTVSFRMRDYAGSQATRQGTGKLTLKIEKFEKVQELSPSDEGVGNANKYLVVTLSVKGDAANYGQPAVFLGLPYKDPAPEIYLVDKTGKKYKNETSKSMLPTFRLKNGSTLLTIHFNDPALIGNCPVFIVPNTIEQPTLVIASYLGGGKLGYDAVKLY
jgi:hypothetical protein